MENFSCSEGRPPDEGVPDVLMVDDVAGEDGTDPNVVGEQCGVLEECIGTGAGDMSADHVDIETCDQLMAEIGGPVIKTETEPPIKSEQMEESELEEEKEPLDYDLAQGNRILTEIMSDANKSLNWPFMDPVDTEGMGLADYHERVREPMWLKKIREKFDKRMYTTVTEFARDFRLMLENCYRYNGPDHYVSKRGQKLDTVFEQKLGLLSRDLREKTSIAATSGKPIEDKIITGTRRRKVLTPHDSSDLLNKLRQEEKDRERENRKLQVEERRQQQQAAVQELIDWEDELLGPGGREYLYAMWELPQIGHFLFLTADLLNTGEVMQWEVERSFWMPRQSPVLQVIMTSLLSTPYQRTKLESKPPMPYKLWEDKLRTRVRNWYKIFNENNRDTKKTHMKIGLEEKFFKVVGMTNPLERQKFHELTFYQRVWIVKSLCDWCLTTQESIREVIETQPLVEQRHYDLGTDAEGNSYIHFPQFCGQDLRVYRVAPIEMPKTERPKVIKEEKKKSPKKRKGAARRGRQTAPTPSTKQRQSSRRRAPSSHSESSGSSSDSGINESEGSDVEAPITKSRRKSPACSSSKPSSVTNTPTKGRSSRTSAAAREWMPRDTSLLSELTGRRGSRSQRLTCALVNNSGTSTPTTIATPSGSRTSTPVPTQEPSSRSSTPSLDASSSRASSPSKLPASSSSSRKKRTKGSRKTKKQAVESDQSEDEETSMDIVDKAVDNGDNVNSATQDDSVTDSNAAPTITNQDGGSKPEGSCVNGFLPGEEEGDSRVGTPFSSYSAEDSSLCGVPGTSDTKTTCDIDSKLACTQQPTPQVDAGACLPDNGTSPVETRVNRQCEGATKMLSRGGSLKGSSFDGDNCENQFCLCKCDGLKEGAVDCSSLNQRKSHLEGKDTSADGSHVYSESDMPLVTNDTVTMPNVDTQADPVLPIKMEPETDMPVIDGPDMYESQSDLNDILMPELEPMSMEPMDIKPTLPELTDVKMALGEQEIKQEPGNDVVAEPVINGEQTPGSVVKQEEEEHLEPEIKYPEVGPFRLIADSVEMLKELSLLFAEPEPIIEIKGKKEKILRPPPRKRCVSDLYDRLVYLLKELEPWESKLLAVNKKARTKLRKEVENYVEENEAEEVEDVWESEESQSEDSDENEDSEDEAEEEIVEELVKEVKKEPVASVTASPAKSVPKSAKKTIVLIPPPDTDASTSNDSTKFSNDTEKSSFGRVRKRKVIPNAYDEPPPVIKKKKGREHSPSPTPNILASSRSKNKAATQEPNSIDSLRTALSKAKPVSTPSALPPGMQLLNIGGQNVLLNTNTNPPVILQTSAPLNLNNLTLLAQLSAKAAAGNSLSSKMVVNSTSSVRTAVATTRPAQATSAPLTSPPPQQVIRTLLAAGHAPQHPKARIIQPAVTPMTKSTPLTPSSAVQQLQFVQSAVSTATSSVTTLASSLPPGSLATQISGQSLLQQNSAAGDNTRPQFYKYNDMSQMKATIRQQLVKTSQGLRTKSTVCTMPTGNTALSNLIQAGLLPQSPRMTSSTVQPAATSQVITTKATPTVLTIPVKSHNSSEFGAGAMSAPIAPTTVVASVEGKPPSILSQVLASTGPAGPQQTVVHTDIPSATKQLQLKQLQPQAQAPQQQPVPQPQQPKPQPQLQPQKVQQPQQLQQPQQQQQTQHVVGGTSTQSILQSPTSKNTQSTVTILTSPQKSPVGTHILPKGQLSPEFKAAIKMGIVNESNIGSLIHANPGLAKALNNTMRPKYASNVTVKSLLESRALRQKAQLYGEAETSAIPSAVSPPGASVTVSPQKTAASPIKVQGLNLPTPNDKPVAIQIHSVNPKPQVVQTPTSAVSPHLVISAKPQQVGKTKTLPLQVQNIKTEDQTQVPPTTVSKTPIQLQAVRTSQGTILRTLSGQQVTVRPAGARLQLGSGGQQMVRLVSPTGAVQLVDTSLPTTPKQPTQPNTIATSALTLTTLDEAVKSVVTSVPSSIPPTPLSIARPFSTSGQPPMRQVTMTTNTMKSPIPSVTHMPAAETPVATAVGQTAKVILSPNSTSITPGQVVSGSVGVPSVSGTQKNVVLRVVPGQQQIMTSQGLINMVVPQQLLEQSLKAESGTGKLVLQAGKGGLQLTQMATTQSTASSPIKVSTHPSPALPRPAIKQPTTQSNPRTITVFPPGHMPPQTAPNLDAKQTFVTSMQSQALPTEPRSHVQIKLVPQTSGVAQMPPGLAIGAEQQPKANHTLVLKKDGSLSIGANPVAQPQTVLVHKAQQQQQQQRQGLPRMTSPVKQVVAAQSNIRVVSPQLTLSSAGLVPVRMTQPRMQLSQATRPAMIQAVQTQPVSTKQEADIKPPPFLLERDGMGEVTSSLDLLAAASMLQEAKAPLPPQIQPQLCNSRANSSTQLASSGVRIQDNLQVSPQSQQVAPQPPNVKRELSEHSQVIVSREPIISQAQQSQKTTTPTIPLNKFHQQQAMVLEQQIKLQQQMLEEQQKQQKLIRQLTLQQEVALGAPATCKPQPQVLLPAAAPSPLPAAKVLVTTPAKMPRTVPDSAMVPSSGTATPAGTQMAGVMASAGGRMVQLRFAVPAGMNVQQLLQTSQFQQQLAALKVSAIHGITTSTVTATSSTKAAASIASPVSSSLLTCPEQVVVSSRDGQAAGHGHASAVHTPVHARPVQVGSGPVRLVTTAANNAAASVTTPSKPVPTGKTLTLPQGAATVVAGQQPGNKVTVLVNVNGQLVQAQGLSLGSNMRMVSSGGELGTARSAAPKLVATAGGLPVGAKVIQTVNNSLATHSSSQPRFLTAKTTGHAMLTSPTKVVLQPRAMTPQRGTAPHVLVTRTGDGGSTVRLPVGMTLQEAAKSNLLSQLASAGATAGAAPGGLIITKPITVSNTSPQVAYTTMSTVTPQNANFQNGK